MKHDEYLDKGQLSEALSALQAQVRGDPASIKFRVLLFQLLAVLGDWSRALKQLDVIRGMDDSTLAMVHLYRSAIACEMFREAVFRGEKTPVFLGEPESWQALLLEALRLNMQGRHAHAAEVRAQAFEQAPASTGQIDGHEFTWIADADSRLGSMLEVLIDGGYRWVSFSHIRQLTIEKPTDLRDLVWLPAHIRWHSEGESHVLIPTRYPDSISRADSFALSRMTEWDQIDEHTWFGCGQRMLMTDVDDYSLLDTREIHFAPVERMKCDAG